MNSELTSKQSLFKRITSFLVILCMMCGIIVPLMPVTAHAAAPASYTTITADSTASVSITSSGGAKYFKFVPTQSGTYRFYSTNYSGDPYGALLDASGSQLVSNDDYGDRNFQFTYECSANTTYYVKAFMWSSYTGSYTLNVVTVSVTPTPAPGGDVVDINAANGTNYPLFNSGRTGNGYSTSASAQVNNSYNNNSYDLYGDQGSSRDTIQLGLSFTVGVSTSELVRLSINAFDVDEISDYNGTCHERDYIYLVDETAESRTLLSGYLSGQDQTWNTTVFSIDPSNFIEGHTYHFEMNVDCAAGCSSCWIVYVRTVTMEYNINEPGPGPTPDTGIEYADLEASISSSGLVSVELTANAYAEENYTLEYKAVCSADSAQYGGKEYSVTIPTTSTEFNTTFQLESGAPRETYEITVFIKNSAGTVIATRTDTAGYEYSAVSYNSNGGSQNLPTDGTAYSSGDTVTVKFDYIPSLYGYTFLGWSTDRNATVPTYTENGTNTFTIGANDVTLYAVWALDVCEHEWSETTHTDATCTTDGRINYECSCGETRVEIIEAHGHNIETTVETEVTCTSDGLIVDRCLNGGCDYEKRTVIHGEHNYQVTDRQDAACEEQGYTEYTCSNCGDKNYEYFDGRHNYVETSRVEAQVGVDGSIIYTCTECGDSYSVAIPALNPVLKNSAVLLIQNSLPWAEDVNTSLLETLQGRGVVSYYNIINTSAIASTDLTQYGVVFIANDQTTSMYNGLAANAEVLENYVRAGGNLIYGACDEGWGGCGSLTHELPGGVETSNYYSVHNYIVDGLHPIVTGVYTDNRSLADELLKGNYCSHTYFVKNSLPEGTDIILRDANGNPTLVEYILGDGTVIASGLTWEYFYVRNHYDMVTNYSKYAYDDLVTYMVYMSNTCEHNYEMIEVVEPTCEENGYTLYVCSVCSHEYKGDIVVAPGHDFVEVSRTEGNCSVMGEIVYNCHCGEVKTEQTGYGDHISSDWIVDTAATCVPGSQHKECTVCEEILETEAIAPVAEHIASDWIVDVAPTATQTGSRHKECTVCHTVLETEVMEVLAKLVIANVEAKAGHTVRVTIDVQNNPGIIGAVLTINYDSALTLVGVEAGSAWSTLNFTRPAVLSNPCNFVWDGINDADFSDGTIIVLTFRLPEVADVGTVWGISASYTYGNLVNADLDTVDMEIEDGSITVINSIGDVNDDGVVDVADVIVLRRYLAGGYGVSIDETAADMNADGIVTVVDVILLRQLLTN